LGLDRSKSSMGKRESKRQHTRQISQSINH
jgi:hypothetical protein